MKPNFHAPKSMPAWTIPDKDIKFFADCLLNKLLFTVATIIIRNNEQNSISKNK